MKRDMDKVRELLLQIEAGRENIDTHDRTEDAFHLRLLKDAHFIASGMGDFPAPYMGGKENWMDLRLTWAGCEYLDGVRDKGKREKVKRLIASKGESASVETVKAAVAMLIKQTFGD